MSETLRRILWPGLITGIGMLASPCLAEQVVIAPPQAPACNAELAQAVQQLAPGDTLLMQPGTYTHICALRISAKGTAEAPITILGKPGTQLTIITVPQSYDQKLNTLEIVESEYLVLRNLHFRGGSMGVRIMGGHHITLEQSSVQGTQTSAITLNYADTSHIVIRNNQISDTSGNGKSPGEGIYVGCHDASCRVTDSIFEYNTITSLRGNSGGGNDGIEIKRGSGGNIVRYNTIENLNAGGSYPGIFVHGDSATPNLIENNLITDCAEGIRVVGNALVRNNLIVRASRAGIVSSPHEKTRQVSSVSIINNTVIDSGVCAQLNWRSSEKVLFVNNALYCPARTALDLNTDKHALVFNNAVVGRVRGAHAVNEATYRGSSIELDFNAVHALDFSPASDGRLKYRAISTIPGMPENDWAGNPREAQGFASVGAIE